MHNRGEVAESTKKKILDIVEELAYKPNIFASTLASKKSAIFATFLPEPPSVDGYWNKPFIGVKKRISEIRQYGVEIQPFTFSQTNPGNFNDEAKKIIELNPDGVVFAPFFKKESVSFIQQLKAKSIPFVFIDSELKDAGQLSYIGQDSYQSGLVSGKLLDLILPEGNILIIHFAKEMDNQNHLVLREKGFYDWFLNNKVKTNQLFTTEIAETEDETWMAIIKEKINKKNIKGIFVTNSRVFNIGRLIEKYDLKGIQVIGHDLLKENVEFLKKDIVQFLICQRPEEQGYNAINKLFRYVVRKGIVATENYTSIDIVTKENVDYYKEFK
ncbi:MAG: substrate-binding domain-containing protein [Prolixibacteraceae bacterium]|nr:substrate-binding domain-containing protein [Prolixibacteraceae bacterium]MBT6763813.1 substrate-binding domain-containing protein [Prolixibacteraceae bacterium]MBT6998367.1 substrate-binding domain-containing protein [Prolixibacteraceae bacterium]MBT7393856.1 substrate-binding domain-containing protein [Prolixibacteraceae bacterium]